MKWTKGYIRLLKGAEYIVEGSYYFLKKPIVIYCAYRMCYKDDSYWYNSAIQIRYKGLGYQVFVRTTEEGADIMGIKEEFELLPSGDLTEGLYS